VFKYSWGNNTVCLENIPNFRLFVYIIMQVAHICILAFPLLAY
jgi:hypothetical protein